MRNIIFIICILSYINSTYGRVYDKIIVPVTLDKLEDEIVKQEISSIIRGTPTYYLHEYKVKRTRNAITSKYKNNDWMFYIRFHIQADKIKAQTQGRFEAYCPADSPLVANISFYHAKYMLQFTEQSLDYINKEIITVFTGQSITCKTKFYISKNTVRNYLCLSIEYGNKKVDFIFVIKNSTFYQSVIIT